jgi:hypothetical protein
MVVVWMLMILVRRMLSKMLRRFGRWALVMPVAGMAAALFGLNVWTAATVLLALLLAVLLGLVLVGWRQAGRSGALPVAMLGAGICGLWTAASLVRSWGAVGFSMLNAFAVQAVIVGPRQQIVVNSPATAGVRAALPAMAKLRGLAIATQGKLGKFTWSRASWRVASGRVARPHVVILGHSLWWGRLLILGSLLLLALGLWLSPRAVADLRALITPGGAAPGAVEAGG